MKNISPRPVDSALAIVALGSNLGDSRKTVLEALAALEQFSIRSAQRANPTLKSSLWKTSPVDCPPGSPEFINAVAAFVPKEGETPESLLAKLRALEKQFGRPEKKVMNEPRPLDLDLIAFGNEVRNTPELVLPHPRAHLRKFVMQPLSEIAPELVLPGQSKTVVELLGEISSGEFLQMM
jgi:2-amino-4-hydroxy-6-hydroxymethyldihydropteridine diphosphokinase